MAAFLSGLRRNWHLLNPPLAAKQDDALKIGILGAAKIAPMALIIPAKSHPEVVVYAVAARDKNRATAFAKKHGIPVVKDSYDAVLDDAAIDAVYIPLPNGLHFEWSLKALAKGKHVLLEKPSNSNAREAEVLFQHRLLSSADATASAAGPPVLMEAFHSRFTPAWRLFLSTLDRPNVSHAVATAVVPWFLIPEDDFRFAHDLGGGCLLDLGTYTVAALRDVFGAEPTACPEADLTAMPPPREGCDHTYRAQLSFPNGGVGEVAGSMRASLAQLGLPTVIVTHRPVAALEQEVSRAEGCRATRTRRVTFGNFMFAPHYHYIEVEDTFEVTLADSSVERFTRSETKKAYTFREMGWEQPGEVYWSTYRHMLEQFVNRVRGREGTGVFISHEDSIAQARALDLIYSKSGLGPRPSTKYLVEAT